MLFYGFTAAAGHGLARRGKRERDDAHGPRCEARECRNRHCESECPCRLEISVVFVLGMEGVGRKREERNLSTLSLVGTYNCFCVCC